VENKLIPNPKAAQHTLLIYSDPIIIQGIHGYENFNASLNHLPAIFPFNSVGNSQTDTRLVALPFCRAGLRQRMMNGFWIQQNRKFAMLSG
jgi:hypothetical protein